MYLFIYFYILLKFFLTSMVVFFFTSIIFEGGGTNIKSCLEHIWPAAALIKMSPRSVFEEISFYRATDHILSAAVLVPPYQYTVQRHKHSHQ